MYIISMYIYLYVINKGEDCICVNAIKIFRNNKGGGESLIV